MLVWSHSLLWYSFSYSPILILFAASLNILEVDIQIMHSKLGMNYGLQSLAWTSQVSKWGLAAASLLACYSSEILYRLMNNVEAIDQLYQIILCTYHGINLINIHKFLASWICTWDERKEKDLGLRGVKNKNSCWLYWSRYFWHK